MKKRNLLVAVKLTVSLGLIAYLITLIDLGAAKDRLLQADIWLLTASVLVLVIQMYVGAVRWWIVVRAIKANISISELFRLFYIGTFFSQALPSSVGGDPIRMYMAYKFGLPLAKAVNSVFLERAVAVIGLVVVAAMALPLFLSKLTSIQQPIVIFAVAFFVMGGIAGVAFLAVLDRLPERLQRFRLVQGMSTLARDTKALFFKPINLAAATFVGVITQINISFCVYLIAVALDIPVTLVDCIVLMAPVLLVSVLPISIGGWGVREGAMVAAFSLVGVASDASLVLSIAIGVCAIIAALPGGVIWLLRRSQGQAVSMNEAAEAVDTELAATSSARPKYTD